ncbi:MAG: WecB/TagA/CpsF family glycosyltransferase [Oscillospiraceae bacterium]|nr:WecB/TagA/CpsF family glycosyltransferase [Oscillospiraceae bacterium]
MRTEILGVAFDNVDMAEALDRAEDLLCDGCRPHMAVTPNAIMVQDANHDSDLADIIRCADLVIPDGVGVIYASKILGRPLKARVPGVDFAAGLMERMAKSGKTLFLLGAKPGVAEEAAQKLRETYPGLVICGTQDGYFKDSGRVAEQIRAALADVVFVCLGSPKQEKWIRDWGEATGASLLIGLGGSIDVFAGRVERAPEFWQKIGMEWLYRTVKEPKRLGRIVKLPLFLCSAVGARLRGK